MTDRSRTYRFFVEQIAAGELALSSEEAHHARNVLRLSPGAEVELFDGRGRRADARVAATGRKGTVVQVTREHAVLDRPGPGLRLAFAVPKGKRLDWLLEKATELGAASLHPLDFERSVAGQGDRSEARQAKWRGHCIAAAKQCGLDFLPELHPRVSLADFLSAAGPRSGTPGGIVGSLDPGALPIARAVGEVCGPQGASRPLPESLYILVGPEGGFTDAEKLCLAEILVPTRLGHTTLRTETAAVALLAATAAVLEGRAT